MNSPRIIAGKYKNLKLKIPLGIRPITERVKATLFDILDNNYSYKFVADLFSGSGNIGIEALSRNAAHVTFLENDSNSVKILLENLQRAQISEDSYNIYNYDFDRFLRKSPNNTFDLIIADPPFNLITSIPIYKLKDKIVEGGVIVIKIPSGVNLSKLNSLKVFDLIRLEKIGENTLIFLKSKNFQ